MEYEASNTSQIRSPRRRFSWFAGLALCAGNVITPLAFGFDVVPVVPADSVVMEAPPDASPNQARFLGRWEGPLIGPRGQIPHTLVVERIAGKTATALWSTGDTAVTNADVRRLDGTFSSGDDELVLPTPATPASYRLNSNGTLSTTYSYAGGVQLMGTMRKVAGPTIPYAATEASTHWPADIRTMGHVAISTSPTLATLPEKLDFVTPLDPSRQAWIGRWGGAVCRNASCSTKLAVISIDGDEARIFAAWATRSGFQANGYFLGKFVGNELRVSAPYGEKLSYRLRGTDGMELYHISRAGAAGYGVLARE